MTNTNKNANTISDVRTAAQLRAGDLIVTNQRGDLAFVCWVQAGDIGYRDVEGGDYHERTAHPSYLVFLEHPAFKVHRELAEACCSWADDL